MATETKKKTTKPFWELNLNPITNKYHEMAVEEYFSNSKIYNYSNMDEDYVNTLNEYYINH